MDAKKVFNETRIRYILVSIILLIFIIVIGFKFYKSNNKMQEAFANQLPTLREIPNEDLQLFSKKYQHFLSSDIIFQQKGRHPISFFYFDSIYNVIVYKLNSTKDFSFNKQFHFTVKKMDRTVSEIYSLHNLHGFDLQNIYAPVNTVSQIYFTLYGDSLKTDIRNDSVISYNLYCRNFSLRYGDDTPIDFLLSRDEQMFERIRVLPMNLLFLKRNDSIYFIFLTPRFKNVTIPPMMLYNAIMGI